MNIKQGRRIITGTILFMLSSMPYGILQGAATLVALQESLDKVAQSPLWLKRTKTWYGSAIKSIITSKEGQNFLEEATTLEAFAQPILDRLAQSSDDLPIPASIVAKRDFSEMIHSQEFQARFPQSDPQVWLSKQVMEVLREEIQATWNSKQKVKSTGAPSTYTSPKELAELLSKTTEKRKKSLALSEQAAKEVLKINTEYLVFKDNFDQLKASHSSALQDKKRFAEYMLKLFRVVDPGTSSIFIEESVKTLNDEGIVDQEGNLIKSEFSRFSFKDGQPAATFLGEIQETIDTYWNIAQSYGYGKATSISTVTSSAKSPKGAIALVNTSTIEDTIKYIQDKGLNETLLNFSQDIRDNKYHFSEFVSAMTKGYGESIADFLWKKDYQTSSEYQAYSMTEKNLLKRLRAELVHVWITIVERAFSINTEMVKAQGKALTELVVKVTNAASSGEDSHNVLTKHYKKAEFYQKAGLANSTIIDNFKKQILAASSYYNETLDDLQGFSNLILDLSQRLEFAGKGGRVV